MEKIKRIPMTGLSNLRDMGGYQAESKTVLWHKLFRSDLPLCDEAGWNYLYEQYHITCVIDLRSNAEKGMQDYKYYHPKIHYEQISLFKEIQGDQKMLGKKMFEMSMADQYLNIVLSNPQAVTKVLSLIAAYCEEGAILFHCTAGKDRTGIIAYFLYQLLGVEKSDILADYQVSATYHIYGNGSGNELLMEMTKKDHPWLYSYPETLLSLMKYFDEHDPVTFLMENGMKNEEIDRLKKNLLK